MRRPTDSARRNPFFGIRDSGFVKGGHLEINLDRRLQEADSQTGARPLAEPQLQVQQRRQLQASQHRLMSALH